MLQQKIFNVLNNNLALRPQHQQRNKIPIPKVVQHLLIKKYVTRKTKHIKVNKIVTRKGGLNCDPLKIIMKLKSDSQVVYLE